MGTPFTAYPTVNVFWAVGPSSWRPSLVYESRLYNPKAARSGVIGPMDVMVSEVRVYSFRGRGFQWVHAWVRRRLVVEELLRIQKIVLFVFASMHVNIICQHTWCILIYNNVALCIQYALTWLGLAIAAIRSQTTLDHECARGSTSHSGQLMSGFPSHGRSVTMASSVVEHPLKCH